MKTHSHSLLQSVQFSHSESGTFQKNFASQSEKPTCFQFSHFMSDSLWPYGLQHAWLPWPSSTPGACSDSWPSSRWCQPTIHLMVGWDPTLSSSVVPFSSRLQSFPASGSFQMSQFFSLGGQSIGVSASASVLPIISWHCIGLSRVFSTTTVQKHQFSGAQPSL